MAAIILVRVLLNKLFYRNFVQFQVMTRLQKACLGYEEWKAQHKPDCKPWRFPEQSLLPPFNPADIGSMTDAENAVTIDETSLAEENVEDNGEELARVQ